MIKNNVTTLDILLYEDSLEKNIEKLFNDLEKNGLKNINCTEYYEIPKSLENDTPTIKEKVHFFSSSIAHHQINNDNTTTLKFRKVINADINFHIISALWIEKIGQHVDKKFGNDIYGSRLVRIKPVETSSCEFDVSNQDYNLDSPRIFEPYQHKYQSWRNNSFLSIRKLHKSSSVIAITMDITSFYHSIKLDFFVDNNFYEEFELKELFSDFPLLKIFHQDFIKKLVKWNESISNDTISHGVPIGLSASSILANAIMRDFDNSIEENLAPTYYGRYVDDILLVFPDNGKIKNGEDVIEYLLSKEVVHKGNDDDLYYKYFRLKKSKQKIFYLDKNADLSIIDAIESEINSVSSEWRFMPDIGDKQSSLLNKIIGFYADGEEFNDALRKIDATTIKRLGLSLLISHSHSLNQYIHPKEWKDARLKVYDLIENHIFIPQNFFCNFTFIPKILRLMIHSEDGEQAYCFLEKVLTQIDTFNKGSNITLKESNGRNVQYQKFSEYSYYLLQEVFLESYNGTNKIHKRYYAKITDLLFNRNTSFEKSSIKILNYYNKYKTDESQKNGFEFENIHFPKFELDSNIAIEINNQLFLRDLSYDGYAISATEHSLSQNEKSIFNTIISNNRINKDFSINIHSEEKIYIDIINEFNVQLIKDVASNLPLVFPTRLFSAIDISIMCSTPDCNHNLFKFYINALRGTHITTSLDAKQYVNNDNVIQVDNKYLAKVKKIKIAITNFEVRDDYWKQSVIQKPTKTIERYNQISRIVKEAVKKRPHYLVLPELAIPQEWAWLISKKLLLNNISLITGVEYIHTKKESIKIVHNSIMYFLLSDDIGFNYMRFYRQDKTEGAYSETIELKNIANIELHPHVDNKEKHIYKHGNFYFSSLICNELTDIENRMNLRGKVDALFAIEWNRDIKTFNALVESASLDIHSYVIQVNNRNYGDSRIRAPFSNDYQRDIVQVRGGNHDYLIVGEIDIKKLRDFQSHNISPTKPFKPTPTGFEMLDERKNWKNEFSEDEE